MVDPAYYRHATIDADGLNEICKVMAIKKKLVSALRKVAGNPFLNLSAGMILILTAVVEIINSPEEAGLGAHHGVLMFGILHAVTALPEILHGVDALIKADEEL